MNVSKAICFKCVCENGWFYNDKEYAYGRMLSEITQNEILCKVCHQPLFLKGTGKQDIGNCTIIIGAYSAEPQITETHLGGTLGLLS